MGQNPELKHGYFGIGAPPPTVQNSIVFRD
jgi:hypothetical protein